MGLVTPVLDQCPMSGSSSSPKYICKIYFPQNRYINTHLVGFQLQVDLFNRQTLVVFMLVIHFYKD